MAGVVGIAACLFSGCASSQTLRTRLSPSYQAENVFAWSSVLPGNVKRVAVLPLGCDPKDADLVEGREALEPVLRAELSKTRKFEVLNAEPELLRAATGRNDWTGEEALPGDFLRAVSGAYGCDAVLFCRLTVFRAYAPMAIGWRLRLVDTRTKNTIWAADEVFDAGKPGVISGARGFRLSDVLNPYGEKDNWAILHSPRQFGQYAAAKMLASLPKR
jgi:hypothetical protein